MTAERKRVRYVRSSLIFGAFISHSHMMNDHVLNAAKHNKGATQGPGAAPADTQALPQETILVTVQDVVAAGDAEAVVVES